MSNASSGIDKLVPQSRQTQIFRLVCACATCNLLPHTGQSGTISHGSVSSFDTRKCCHNRTRNEKTFSMS
jgi:hypothetical protein